VVASRALGRARGFQRSALSAADARNGSAAADRYTRASAFGERAVGSRSERRADRFFGKRWELLLPEAAYARSDPDDAAGEISDDGRTTFPHDPAAGLHGPGPEFYDRLFAWAEKHDVFVISDIAYCDLSLEPSYRCQSFLEFDRTKKRTVEYHSFSKSYSMQGWRIGFVVGNADAIGRLAKIKANMDFGVFTAIQRGAIAALTGPQDYTREVAAIYRKRRDVFLAGVRGLGFELPAPKAGMYVWLPIPKGYSNSIDFTADLLDKTGVVVSPGSGFGTSGEGYVRIALCDTEERLAVAVKRMADAGISAAMAGA